MGCLSTIVANPQRWRTVHSSDRGIGNASLYGYGAFLVLISLAASAASQPAARPAPLFVAAEPEAALADPEIPSDDSRVLRQRLVRIDDDILEVARRAAGRAGIAPPLLLLNLFEDELLRTVVDRTGPTSAGYWLSGQVEGSPLSSVTLVVNGDVVAATVRTLAGTFSIRTVGDDAILAIREIDPSAHHLGDVAVDAHPYAVSQQTDRLRPIRPPARDTPGSRSAATSEPGAAEDGSRIDVMVVYTPAARDAEGGREEIEALIDLWVAETNQAYADSGVIQRLRLVRSAEVEYSGKPGDVRSPVDRLVHPSDGYLDEVHVLRDRYKADLVHLVLDNRFTGPGSICRGEAKLVRNPSSRDAAERTPFSSTTIGCDAVVFAHETGHSMGLSHDRYAEIHGCCGHLNMAWPYSHGYVNQRGFEADAPASSRWYTIMTSNSRQCHDAGYSCARLLRFSNPDMTYNGDPMGVPGEEPSLTVDGPADARRSLNEARGFVANFRVAPCLRGGQRVRLPAGNGHYVVAAGNGGGDVLANRPAPGPWGRFTVYDRNGGCVRAGDTISISTSDRFYLRARRGGGSTLDATAPRPTPWARFVVRRRRPAGGAVRSGDAITLQTHTGHYVVAAGGGGSVVNANSSSPGPWERFTITRIR